jgi:hypothetical protein
MEDWDIWQRWESAFHSGKTDHSTHPALPNEAERHSELKRILDGYLATEPDARTIVIIRDSKNSFESGF